MTISYKWISEYIPVEIEPEKVSQILTSIGLEVESMEPYESIRGGLKGLVVGEVIECHQHPGADKLKVTLVDTGNGEPLKIVCGAPNVAKGQKVIVATAGTTIYPLKGEPVTMKTTKIRGEESQGMICAEDEIGLGEGHEGIFILPGDLPVGSAVSEHFDIYTDWIYEIGLTPNRMDAMSHFGVARDVCAYLSHHEQKNISVKNLAAAEFRVDKEELPFEVVIKNTEACKRYTGVSIAGIQVKPSPQWLQDKLKSLGQRPINNIVDITNYILHDTGQPLHAFDADKVKGRKIVVTNLPEGTVFKTLDDKERKLSGEDLMICDVEEKGMCIAGVFGGIDSGVEPHTANIFLESAWFNPISIRKTSFRHSLRTDAATRFEKHVDISNTFDVLKRAATMIVKIAGGHVASQPLDVYPAPEKKKEVRLEYSFLRKLSGKSYEPATVKKILTSLGFEIIKADEVELILAVPYSKPDVQLQADLVEEVMRIDGYDQIEIPARITIAPSVGAFDPEMSRKEKTAAYLAGAGFSEIFTNSITNAAYFEGDDTGDTVKLLNNLSAVHNIMRPSMLETGLESIGYNLNRKNTDLLLFEFGETYHAEGVGRYREVEHLCLYSSGFKQAASWKEKPQPTNIFFLKGVTEAVLKLFGVNNVVWSKHEDTKTKQSIGFYIGNELVAAVGQVSRQELSRFDIKQDVYFADIKWRTVIQRLAGQEIRYTPLPNQLPVTRDLAMVVSRDLLYSEVEKSIRNIKLDRLRSVNLFDVFESEKLGSGRKSLALSFTFLDEEKTLTDKEIDGMMKKIMRTLEQDLKAEIRKGAENTTT